MRSGICAAGPAQRDLCVAWVKDVRGQLHQRVGRAVAVWRTDQGGHSAHPEMLDALLPAQIHRLAGDGFRHRQAVVSQRRFGLGLQICGNGNIVPLDMPGNAPICGHAGLAVDDFPGLHKVIRQVTVRQISDSQAILALWQDSSVDRRAVNLTG